MANQVLFFFLQVNMANQVHAEENNFFTSNYTCTTNNLTLHLALIVVPFELEISSNDEENSIENDGLTVSFRFTNIEHLLTGLTKT